MERESSLDERLRKDKEKADAIRARQIRLGHVPAPEEPKEEPKEEKPKPKAKAKAKSEAE